MKSAKMWASYREVAQAEPPIRTPEELTDTKTDTAPALPREKSSHTHPALRPWLSWPWSKWCSLEFFKFSGSF